MTIIQDGTIVGTSGVVHDGEVQGGSTTVQTLGYITTGAAVFHYKHAGDFTDSGSAASDLIKISGNTATFVTLMGRQFAWYDGSIYGENTTSSINLPGDCTISMLVYPIVPLTTGDVLIAKGPAGTDASNTTNVQFQFGNNTNAWEWFHESTGGVNETASAPSFTVSSMGNTGYPELYTGVRDATANTITFYRNGVATGAAQSYTNDVNDGSAGLLYIGGVSTGGSTPDGMLVGDVIGFSSALSAAQVLAQYNEVFGG